MTYQQAKVARKDELAPGEMKQVKVGETEVLLARYQDDFFATAAHCTHYGAPLKDGLLHGKRIICPWHHACFDVTNGDHLEPPGCDSLPSFEVKVEGEDIIVKVPDDAPSQRMPDMQSRDKKDSQLNLIVGAGTAAQYAAEAMRSNGFRGRILMLTPELEKPYDRPNCSKEYLQGEAPDEWMPLRPAEFYEDHDIEVMHKVEVSELDVSQKQVSLTDGQTIKYDKVLLCTGGKAIKPDMPGTNLQNVFTLRSMADSKAIMEAAKQVKKVLIVGSSFIGMESAWSLNKLGCEVTVVAPEEYPFASLWGDKVGKMIQEIHAKEGINFFMGRKVEQLKGNQHVQSAVLDKGDELETELVLIGVGVKPATSYVKALTLADDGGVVVDKHFSAGQDVYAAGDIAEFTYHGRQVRIEHWRVAGQQGRIAGANMSGQSKTYDSVPFFWTAQHSIKLRYVGHVKAYDDIIFDGKVEEQEFLAYYVKEGDVKAVLGLNRDGDMLMVEELLRLKKMPSPSEIKSSEFKLKQYFNAQKQLS
ncbi:NADPH-dependent 2,4-dienoyl-CoA reductase/sulfur reductase-like enzyme/nitrite reductase/ring-hydroxylating ferredoxin subunit [Catalinimonas alkaloidigena]|uniref:apoptosis inducing factor family protein n=1 Tax=Catalinimonas alkaloidigena TaxID=1075417 RepID=UPI0024063A7A|nr:apoptosis inducing factor family protein [Catalinimonas alkaloidigena]MDF9795230.1 NADPH-dependent 2,4-dienoyl-CoA reductase/sulfur reductase-like enzyme/nitrite reductase/ring-hydroxylating ferredoxin subunit [Catalinimonas alkaloidigena]